MHTNVHCQVVEGAQKVFDKGNLGGQSRRKEKNGKIKKSKEKAHERNRFCQVSDKVKEKTDRLLRDAEGRCLIYMVASNLSAVTKDKRRPTVPAAYVHCKKKKMIN